MVTRETGSVKKVKFYVALAAFLGVVPAMAAELDLPMAKVQQELSQKTEEAISEKLRECQPEAGDNDRVRRYPVRIAETQRSIGAVVSGASVAAP